MEEIREAGEVALEAETKEDTAENMEKEGDIAQEVEAAPEVEEDKKEHSVAENDIAKKEEELGKREEALNKREIEAAAKELIKEKNIPDSALEFLLCHTQEETTEKINRFSEVFNDAVEQRLNEKIAGESPKDNMGNVGEKTAADIFSAALRR